MDRPRALVLLLALLTLCITAGEWGTGEKQKMGQGGDPALGPSYACIPQGPLKCGCKFRWRPPSPRPSLSAVDSWDLVLSPW